MGKVGNLWLNQFKFNITYILYTHILINIKLNIHNNLIYQVIMKEIIRKNPQTRWHVINELYKYLINP